MGLGLLPRLILRLRLSVLNLSFLLELRLRLRLGERGVIERRAGERDLETCLPLGTSEYGDRVRTRPLDDDLEGMV
jgi:hypothetical protein